MAGGFSLGNDADRIQQPNPKSSQGLELHPPAFHEFSGLVLTAAIGLRYFDLTIPLVLSTLAAGAAIGMAGVLLPVVIRRDFPHHIGLMTGFYTMALSAGGATGAGLTPVIERSVGTWNLALAVWGVPALLAAVLWARAALAQPRAGRAARIPSFFILIRDPIAWAVTGYMGLQAALAFIVLGWIPTLLRDRGLDVVDAGIVTSVSIIAQTSTALLTPVLAVRTGSPRVLVTAVLLMSVTGFLGLLYAPLESRVVWGLVLGLGQGGHSLSHCSSSHCAHPRRKRQPCSRACPRASATLGPRLVP